MFLGEESEETLVRGGTPTRVTPPTSPGMGAGVKNFEDSELPPFLLESSVRMRGTERKDVRLKEGIWNVAVQVASSG